MMGTLGQQIFELIKVFPKWFPIELSKLINLIP